MKLNLLFFFLSFFFDQNETLILAPMLRSALLGGLGGGGPGWLRDTEREREREREREALTVELRAAISAQRRQIASMTVCAARQAVRSPARCK